MAHALAKGCLCARQHHYQIGVVIYLPCGPQSAAKTDRHMTLHKLKQVQS